MSNVIELNKDPMDEASLWITRLDRGLSEQEQVALKVWLQASQTHVDIFMQLVKLWDKMESLSQLSELFPHKPQHLPNNKISIFAWAASFIFASLISVSLWLNADIFFGQDTIQVVQFNSDYETKIGEQSTFFLQDKTKIKLNTNSLVRVTYTDKQRVFELLRGEMHVVVAHNKRKPLSVYAGTSIIQAVGTSFNVELGSQQVELIVTDGKVLVSDINSQTVEPLKLKNVYLSPKSFAVNKGQKAQLKASNTSIIGSDKGKLASDLAWQQGNLIFRGESLFDAMQEVSRYTNYQFDFGDEDTKSLQIAGLFKTSDISGLLAALESNFNVVFKKMSSNKIRLSKKPLTE
ncbi:MAG: transmembrane sensor [Paraglaciecola sp.]|jgi:transmembrane sensor